MTTETEMRRIVGFILWNSGEMFIGDVPSTHAAKTNESHRPGLIAKMVDGSEFRIVIEQVR